MVLGGLGWGVRWVLEEEPRGARFLAGLRLLLLLLVGGGVSLASLSASPEEELAYKGRLREDRRVGACRLKMVGRERAKDWGGGCLPHGGGWATSRRSARVNTVGPSPRGGSRKGKRRWEAATRFLILLSSLVCASISSSTSSTSSSVSSSASSSVSSSTSSQSLVSKSESLPGVDRSCCWPWSRGWL